MEIPVKKVHDRPIAGSTACSGEAFVCGRKITHRFLKGKQFLQNVCLEHSQVDF